MITRRDFLGALTAGLAAPAIVRAESLMKLYVPNKEFVPFGIILPDDHSMEFWFRTQDWHNAVLIRAPRLGKQMTEVYIDGVHKKSRDIQNMANLVINEVRIKSLGWNAK